MTHNNIDLNTQISQNLPESDAEATLLPLYGGAQKPVSQMTVDEFDRAAQLVYDKVREQAFSRGLPVIVGREGHAVKEFSDGHIEPVAA